MAKNDTVPGAVPEPTAARSSAALYTANELAAAARSKFGTTPEVVLAALKTAGKEKAALDDAAAIVKAFLAKEVK